MAGASELQWYAVRVRPQQRQILRGKYATDPANAPFMVEHWLRQKGFETFTPRRKVFRFVNGVGKRKREKVERAFPAFVGWTFVGWPEGENRWRELRDTPGVTGVAGQDGKAIRINARSIRLLARDLGLKLTAPQREKHMPTHKEYAPGQAVRVTSGPLADRMLTVIDVKGPIARVLLPLLGTDREVEIDAMLLEAA